MRIGLYVFKPSTVTIEELVSSKWAAAAAPSARPAVLAFRRPGALQAVGSLQLEAGIYQVLSQSPVQITGDAVQVVVVPNDKDGWPKPPPLALALEPGATEATIEGFFATAKDASPNG